MVKRPPFNPGTGNAAVGKPLPNVDVNPETNPATAAFAAGAAVKTDYIPDKLGNSVPLKPLVSPAPQLEKPRFSLLASDMTLLDDLATEYRRSTGQEVTPSRIV